MTFRIYPDNCVWRWIENEPRCRRNSPCRVGYRVTENRELSNMTIYPRGRDRRRSAERSPSRGGSGREGRQDTRGRRRHHRVTPHLNPIRPSGARHLGPARGTGTQQRFGRSGRAGPYATWRADFPAPSCSRVDRRACPPHPAGSLSATISDWTLVIRSPWMRSSSACHAALITSASGPG